MKREFCNFVRWRSRRAFIIKCWCVWRCCHPRLENIRTHGLSTTSRRISDELLRFRRNNTLCCWLCSSLFHFWYRYTPKEQQLYHHHQQQQTQKVATISASCCLVIVQQIHQQQQQQPQKVATISASCCLVTAEVCWAAVQYAYQNCTSVVESSLTTNSPRRCALWFVENIALHWINDCSNILAPEHSCKSNSIHYLTI